VAARRKAGKKKTATRKKAAKKAKARAPAAPMAAAKAGSEAAAEVAVPEASAEARLPEPLHEMERLLGAFRRRDWLRPFGFDWPAWPELSLERFPSIDVVDRDKEIQVKAEIPGIEKDDLSVTVTDRTLTIKGETRHEEESDEGELHRREIRRGSFSRSLTLPEDVDGSKAKASYKDGVLELTLPKRRRSKRHAVGLD
jgi:HSP20 family protein